MMRNLQFFVPGIPAPGGSKRHVGHGILVDAGKHNKEWRTAVAWVGSEHCKELFTGPLVVRFCFRFVRPQGHYGSGKNAHHVKASAPRWPAVRPDTTKLIRSTEDALTGIVWRDDAQIIDQHAYKEYAEQAGCLITISEAAA